MSNTNPRVGKIKQLLQDAWSVRRERDYEKGRNILQIALNLCKETDYEELGRIWAITAQFDRDCGDLESALNFSRRSCECYRSAANDLLIAHSIRHTGDILLALREHSQALESYEEALNIYRSNAKTDKQDLANTLRPYGLLLINMEEPEKAKQFLEEARELYNEVGSRSGVEEMTSILDSIE